MTLIATRKIRKFDIIIIAILIIISVVVLFRADILPKPDKDLPPVIRFKQDDESNKLIVTYVSEDVKWTDLEITGECDKSKLGSLVIKGDMLTKCFGKIRIIHIPTDEEYGPWVFSDEIILPESIIPTEKRTVSPRDEGAHYKNKLFVNREWWYFTVIFNENSQLPGWTATISFNHMARNDLFFSKPDLLIVTLHSPDGKEYGGIIERKRPILGEYAFLDEPVLQVSSSDQMLKVTFEDSYFQGIYPNWYLHVETDIDGKSDISMDLKFNAESSSYWTYSSRLIDNSKSSVASYIFMGCSVEGTVEIGGINFEVKGIGHHDHTWINGLLTSGLIRGWDWCHMKFENGWNIYYSNYYFTPQFKSTKKYKINPFSNIIITQDNGKRLTILEDIKIDIKDSDRIFLLLNMPNKIKITAEPNIAQVPLKDTNINLELNLDLDGTLDKQWKRLAHVGMKIGRTEANGVISWNNNDKNYEVELEGIGSIWCMRH